jgi:hypothetical protein
MGVIPPGIFVKDDLFDVGSGGPHPGTRRNGD